MSDMGINNGNHNQINNQGSPAFSSNSAENNFIDALQKELDKEAPSLSVEKLNPGEAHTFRETSNDTFYTGLGSLDDVVV